uniref:alpha-2-macroglobulin family protein n=1 Tax=Ochrovirga pacifica TaxID=1042376 RepID=UPI0002559AD1
MKKIVLSRVLLFVSLVCFFVACQQSTQVKVVNDSRFNYSQFVYNHTSGVNSVAANIVVTLAKATTVDQSQLQKVLTFSPKAEGTLQIINQKQLVFVPKKPFQGNTTYKVTMALDQLFPDQKTKKYQFTFTTKKQAFDIKTKALQSYSQDWQYINGVIKTSDVTTLDNIKSLITAKQNGKPLSVVFDEIDIPSQTFLFKIDSIYRELDDSKIQLHYNGKALKIEHQQIRELQIPGKNNFKVVDVKVVNGASQYVSINFSDPVAKNQNLKGLISIANVNNLSYSIDGNVVKVYPKSKTLKGDYKVSIYRGIKNSYGYKFNEQISRLLSFDEPKPEVKFSKSGTILPNSKGLNIQFEAINLKAVEVTIYRIYESNVLQFLQQNNLEGKRDLKMVARPMVKKIMPLHPTNNVYSVWQTYGIALDQVVNVEQGAIYKVKINIRKEFSTYQCASTTASISDPIAEENYDDEIETSAWDGENNYYSEYNYSGEYNWRDRDNPCTNSYYRNKVVSKNILASNIGIMAKKGKDNSFFISTQNLIDATPLAQVQLDFYNYQQQKIASTQTDENGIRSLQLKEIPYVITAKKDGQTTYLKVNDGNVLSMSNFNTQGVEPLKGLKGFLYTERGVWRPGDTIFTSFMLNDLKNKLPKNHPVTLEVKDSRGTLKFRQVSTHNLNNLYCFKVPTQDTDPTGTWTAKVVIGGANFSKNLKVETIKPNRLKINIQTSEKVLTTHNSQINLSAKWLHGAIAKNLKVETDLLLRQSTTTFDRYPNYVFDDPSKRFESEEINVYKGTLNAEGKTKFAFNPKVNNHAPGMLKAFLTTKVYEKSGDFSTDVYPKTFSPFNTYVGLKRPVGDKARNMLLTDKKHTFNVVSVTEQGTPVPNRSLEVKIYKMENSWWWNNNNNYSQFQSATYTTPVFHQNIATNTKGTASFNYELKYPEWGRYFVKVTDRVSGHSTGETVFIDWPGWAGKAKKGNQKEAAMLVFTTNKETYQVGEQVQLNFPSAANGHALITIENSQKVIKHFVVPTQKGSTDFQFKVDKSMTPTVYISISSLQPHHNTANDLPIRMYGVKPIVVEDANTHLNPVLDLPKEVAPEKEFVVKVSEKNKKPFSYTLAIVDEGLLDLTRFKTPNPWDYFNAKEALGVKTWDMYDDVIGAFGGTLNQVFSIGGDVGLAAAKTQKANRFKPVVIFKGPFSLEAGNSNIHRLKIPLYIGSVKVMVVAHQPEEEAYGKTDASLAVKKPIMLLASAPRKVSKGERIRVPVTVFNSLSGSQKIKVQLQTNKLFTVEGNKSQTVSFDAPGDDLAYFDLKANQSGIGKINITATNTKGHKAKYTIEMNAYNPNKKISKTMELILDGKESKKIELNGFGVDDSNTGTIEVSSFPQINFTNRLKYLIRYPHGCLEQTVSKAFPQLYMGQLFELDAYEKQNCNNNISKAVEKLKNYQLLSGGFTYWPGSVKANPWVSNYAGHFMLEAEKQGYLIAPHNKNNWISYQKEMARTWVKSKEHPDLEQAYRLYTLALAQNPELSVM